MTTTQQQTPAQAAVARQRPLHTRKSAWKLGWPDARTRRQEPSPPQPASL